MTGRSSTHVADAPDLRCRLHPAALDALRQMRHAAVEAGIDLDVVSAFRDFDRQLAIWNGKFRGERPLLDRSGQPLARDLLDEAAAINAILAWSALPGASRHHWGTDFDVIDRAQVSDAYVVRLTADEFAPGGVFGELSRWLEDNMRDFGFFRPYRIDRGGVQPEPWHLSFASLAVPTLAELTIEVLRDALAAAPIDGRQQVLEQLPELYERYVRAIDCF